MNALSGGRFAAWFFADQHTRNTLILKSFKCVVSCCGCR